MRLFGLNEAQHYCAAYTPERGIAEGSIETFRQTRLRGHRVLGEGTPLFNEFRACALRDVDRSLFLAASHYRRSLDSLIPSASPWAHVTMYYGAWFAARALLGMFGCVIFDGQVVDVRSSTPGSQELEIRRIGSRVGDEPTTYRGPHRTFWDLFYRAAASLRPLVSAGLSVGLAPVSSDPVWQIQHRNNINYDTFTALKHAKAFQLTFAPTSFPSSLPGESATQYGILEALNEVAFSFARDFSLATDALSALSPAGSRKMKIRKLVYADRPPKILSKTQRQIVLK